jgi:sugar lactone lactonase YvrE
MFDTVLGIVVDRQNRLWVIDHGNHGFSDARLFAFDLQTGELVHDHIFLPAIAPAGSFLQDLQVSADGNFVFIADASFWRKRPAIVIYDVQLRRARRVLESHPSVSPEDYLIRTTVRDMSFLGGMVALKGGVDGIAVDTRNEWLYYGAISQDGLFRVPLAVLKDASIPAEQVENSVERYSNKPLSDGMSTDTIGNVYITDVEHGAIMIVDPDLQLRTLLRSSRIRWADALSFGPDGWLYVADSAIPEQVLRSKDHIRSKGPYYIYRFQPGYTGVPGQ